MVAHAQAGDGLKLTLGQVQVLTTKGHVPEVLGYSESRRREVTERLLLGLFGQSHSRLDANQLAIRNVRDDKPLWLQARTGYQTAGISIGIEQSAVLQLLVGKQPTGAQTGK